MRKAARYPEARPRRHQPLPEEGQGNRTKGRVLEMEKMAIFREKVTKTQGGKNETPDSEKSSLMTRLTSRPLIIPVSSTSQLGESISKMVESSGISPIFPTGRPRSRNLSTKKHQILVVFCHILRSPTDPSAEA